MVKPLRVEDGKMQKRMYLCVCIMAVAFIAGCATVPRVKKESSQIQFVYFYGGPPQATKTVEESSGAIINATKVTDFSKDKGAFYPRISPDGREIAFSLFDFNKYTSNISVMSMGGGTQQTMVTNDEYLNENPCWIDPLTLVFDSDRLGPRSLWITRRDGAGGLKQVTRGESSNDFAPKATKGREGTGIVFTSRTSIGSARYIWEVESSGGNLTQIRKGFLGNWSPDGSKIVYVDEGQIWVMNHDGSNATQLTSDKPTKLDPVWSPDGDYIAYTCDRAKNFDIWVMGSNGSNPTQITTNKSYDGGPCWALDGKSIYFHSNRGNSWNIWRVSLR
jgi:Tol biopolymer transport system component